MGEARTVLLLAVVAFCGCGGAGAAPDHDLPLEPAIVEPQVPMETVGDRLDAVQTGDAARLTAYLDAAARPGQLADADRTAISQPGDLRCWALPFHDAQKIAYVRRRGAHWWATTLPMGEGGRPVPPLTWMGANIVVHRAAEDDLKAWLRELSRRVATSGRASGIALDEDGGATAVVVELRESADHTDVELVSRSLVLRPAQFDPHAWGPVLDHTWGASSVSINGRAGAAICDMLALRPF